MNANPIAWAAELIDGEGCFSATPEKTNVTLYLRVVLVNQPENFEALKRLVSIFGGRISNRPRTKACKTGARDQILWKLYGPKLLLAIDALLPHLIIKKHAAESIRRIADIKLIVSPPTLNSLRDILEIRDTINVRSRSRHPFYRNAKARLKEYIKFGRFQVERRN